MLIDFRSYKNLSIFSVVPSVINESAKMCCFISTEWHCAECSIMLACFSFLCVILLMLFWWLLWRHFNFENVVKKLQSCQLKLQHKNVKAISQKSLLGWGSNTHPMPAPFPGLSGRVFFLHDVFFKRNKLH